MFDFVYSLQEDGFTVLNYAMRLSASLLIDATEKKSSNSSGKKHRNCPGSCYFQPTLPKSF